MTPALLPLAAALTFLPVRTAETVPPGRWALYLGGGLSVLRVGLPALPVLPVPVGEFELAWGLGRGLDLRARYGTSLGLVHGLGPELRARLGGGARWALAARFHPRLTLGGSADERLHLAGRLGTQGALLGTVRGRPGALTAEAGVSSDWLFFEHLAGRRSVDRRPYLSSIDLALEYERPRSARANLAVRLELGILRAPDDPFAVGGLRPRVVVGGSFGR